MAVTLGLKPTSALPQGVVRNPNGVTKTAPLPQRCTKVCGGFWQSGDAIRNDLVVMQAGAAPFGPFLEMANWSTQVLHDYLL